MVEHTIEEYKEDYRWFGPETANALEEATNNSGTEEARERRLEILREYCIKGNPSRRGSAASDKARFTL